MLVFPLIKSVRRTRLRGETANDYIFLHVANAEQRLAAETKSCYSQTIPHAAYSDDMIPVTEIASPRLISLSASIDSGFIHDNAMTLFPDSYGLGNLSDTQSNTTLAPSPENPPTNLPDLDLNIESRETSGPYDMELELSPHALRDL